MGVTGLVVALRAEARCVTRRPISLNEKIVLNEQTILYLSGMGSKAAQTAAEQLCQQGITGLVSFGVAGALDKRLKPGDLVLPDAIYGETLLPVVLEWRNRLQHQLKNELTIVNGVLANSVKTLTTFRSKQDLAAKTGACAVDMESSAIASVAAKTQIPFIAVRAIIDPLEFSLPEALLPAVNADGSVKILPIVKLILTRSVRVGTLLEMSKSMQAACNTLTRVIELSGTDLAS